MYEYDSQHFPGSSFETQKEIVNNRVMKSQGFQVISIDITQYGRFVVYRRNNDSAPTLQPPAPIAKFDYFDNLPPISLD